ncbi:uncharacterized protein CC84DRAFT_1261131 [Paraphaeosphaeria sporulosa]|uniref:Uncharacterized protein n=1 Tax=Paraphaeosphaeria sporulosa TaxID=1460663 RepID=A0A177CB94_9PLEO|nr:uncharacterized protein CC84DRAFT_1261131 [Paraphaeosphaeria sporulosa]OAG04142.1 hypothetical protein CC84DRAFT_1261131 [Paraphaeosphaeria sporulosa]
MSTEKFVVTEQWSPTQLIREYPHALTRNDADLFLAVRESRSRNSTAPSENAVTIIASYGNGFPKECYEALWDEILDSSKGDEARSIWMAEYALQGKSYARNADVLGDDSR